MGQISLIRNDQKNERRRENRRIQTENNQASAARIKTQVESILASQQVGMMIEQAMNDAYYSGINQGRIEGMSHGYQLGFQQGRLSAMHEQRN